MRPGAIIRRRLVVLSPVFAASLRLLDAAHAASHEKEQTSNDAGDEAMQAYAVVCGAHAYLPWYRAKSNE